MEHAGNDEFPKFMDGDVSVALTSTRVFRLHSSILERNSAYFAQLLQSFPAANLNKKARDGGVARYRFEFRKDHDVVGNLGYWIRKSVTEEGHFEASGLLPEIQNGQVANDTYRYWEWLFGTFYNVQPQFDDRNLATLLNGCMGLIDAAEKIGSVDHVRELVDLALLRQGDTLWTSIAGKPTAWAELGCRIHSPDIFKDSICHIVGKWRHLSDSEKSELSVGIRDLCGIKFKELELAKEAIEMRILGHYPSFLFRTVADKPGRPSYSNDIYMWMALDFFRQWFAQNISNGNNRVNADGGYKFYKMLHAGGPAYLDHEDFRNFHQYFPMSSKACSVLERDMGVLKEDVKPFVADLVKSQVHLNVDKHPITWLTCAVVNREDLPWYKGGIKAISDENLFVDETLLPVRQSQNGEDDVGLKGASDGTANANGMEIDYDTDEEG